MTELVVHFTFQIAIILIVAKIFGLLFEKMGQSAVLGELLAGMAIGPYALGAVKLPLIGVLFPIAQEVAEHGAEAAHAAASMPISPELYSFAQIGAIILLFTVGLETDAKMFMRYGLKSLGIALGGVILPFFLGAWGTVLFGFADGIFSVPALFMGAIMTATSVGITARVLSDIYKLDTDEGISILAAAVIDDVLGILTLALVLSIASGGGNISWGQLGLIGLKAVGFIGIVAAIGIIFGKKFANYIMKLGGKTYVVIAGAVCFFIAAMAEKFGLAMIIGAYLTGILFSVTALKHELEEKLAWIAHLMVPVFFAVMGMLVDFSAMAKGLVFGIVITLFAIVGKVLGCGLPAIFSGFNKRGALRIGFGMLPRGEVALIVAGIGLAAGIINQTIFGVSIMMTIVTTIAAPIILIPLFKKGGSGLKVSEKPAEEGKKQIMIEPAFQWEGSERLMSLFDEALRNAFAAQSFGALVDEPARAIVEFENKENTHKLATVKHKEKTITIDCSEEAFEDVKKIVKAAKEDMEKMAAELKAEPIKA